MSYHFGTRSRERLNTCHPLLVEVMEDVIKIIDCTILEGHRGQELQDMYFDQDKSKVQWPNGKHNKLPSLGIDALPYPIDWEDVKRMHVFAGIVIGIAASKGIKIRWGGDWNMNWVYTDQSFHDLPHFELVLKE